MCHLAGYVGEQNAVPKIIESLRVQEGIIGSQATGLAVITNSKVKMEKDIGPVSNFEEQFSLKDFESTIGIGHTRYALKNITKAETNTKEKAHPFWSSKKNFVTMHNGTISNYLEFVEKLEEKGYSFKSKSVFVDKETQSEVTDFCDSEIFGYQLEEELKNTGDIKQAIKQACENIRGHFAFVVLHPDFPETIFIANWMQPIHIGTSSNSAFFSSFANGIEPFSDRCCWAYQPMKNSLITLTKKQVNIEKLVSSRELPEYKPNNRQLEKVVLDAIDNGNHNLPSTLVYLMGHLDKIQMTTEEFEKLSTVEGYTFTPALYQALENLETEGKIQRKLDYVWEGGIDKTPRFNFYRV